MSVKEAVKAEMSRYLKACSEHRMGDAHRHLAAYKRLCRRPEAPVTVHEALRLLAGIETPSHTR